MHLKKTFPPFLLFVIFALPQFAQAAIPFFGPIVPTEINQCAAGWPALIEIINDLIQFGISFILVFVLPLMIAYSGFLLMMSEGDPGKRTAARKVLTNTLLGVVIALSAWMIVDAIMAALYDPNASSGATRLQTWSSLIYGDSSQFCLIQTSSLYHLSQTDLSVQGLNASGSVAYISGKTGAVCADGNTACSPSALQAAGLSPAQANVMSCIAVTESSGVPSTPPYNTTHPGSNSTACGTFQITQTTWSKYASGACSNFSNCTNAACNLQVANTLVANNGYKDWTCTNCNSKAASCIQQYGG
jgi:hypothetical protein